MNAIRLVRLRYFVFVSNVKQVVWMSQTHLYMDIFEGLGEVALSEAILDGDVCLTLRKIQEHLVRCAKNDGFSEFYECDIDDDCKMIEDDCVSIARMLYINPIWLYNGPAVSSKDRRQNKQKIMETIRECTSSLKDDKDETQDNNDGGDDVSFDKVTTDEEDDDDEDRECSKSLESDEIHAGDVCSDESQSGVGDHTENVDESHENVCDEETETISSSSEEDENEKNENGLLNTSTESESESESGDNDSDDDGEVDDVSEVSLKEVIVDDDCISLNLSPDSTNVVEEEIVDWVDDMDMEEVLRIDRCYMNIDDFEFFK